MSDLALREAAKNHRVPGSRVIKRAEARQVYDNNTACMTWLYPMQQAHDFSWVAYIEKRASTDAERPWVSHAHPGVEHFMFVLRGEGTVTFGVGDDTFENETYEFEAGDFVVTPRGIPHKCSGEWDALMFHPSRNVFRQVVGTDRYPHPVLIYDKPPRPTAEERDALHEPGTFYCEDPIASRRLYLPTPYTRTEKVQESQYLRPDLAFANLPQPTPNELYALVTPIQNQSADPRHQTEAAKNPTVLGARVLKKADSRYLYNPNAGLYEWLYEISTLGDLALLEYCSKSGATDKDREGDSHSHPPVQEFSYIVSGEGTLICGAGDDAFEDETYAFEAGDLIIEPHDVPHKESGGWDTVSFEPRVNVYGSAMGTSRFQHCVLIYDKPTRPTQEERDQLFDPGTMFVTESSNLHNVYMPQPYLRVEKAWSDDAVAAALADQAAAGDH